MDVPTLRPMIEDDWRAVHGWASLPEASRYQVWGPNTEQETRTHVKAAAVAWRSEPQTVFPYAVVLPGDIVVGSAELTLRSRHEGEIGYGIHPAHWGRGLATAAARFLLDEAFHTHDLHRVQATVDPRNLASARVLAKLGMRHEGRLRETILIHDGWRDSDLYAILVHEWAGGRPA